MKVFKKLTQKQINKQIKKARKMYIKTSYKEPDEMFVSNIFLPKIITPEGETIDLNEKYKDCKAVLVHIGGLPYLPYFSDKTEDKELLYIHFTEHPVHLVADPDDNRRIFIAHEKLKLTDKGIEG